MPIDPRAEAGFGADAAAYERFRPSYPADAVRRVASELDVGPGSTVLDLGAGTGKLTRELVTLAARVIAVEPVEAMRGVLQEVVPEAEPLAGTAEALPLADRSVDAVFVGEAFHWFRADEAAAEIARVLTAGGGLAVLWQPPSLGGDHPWVARVRGALAPIRRAAGPFPTEEAEWKRLVEGTGAFEPFSRAEAPYVQRLSPDDFVALVGSWSWIASLPDHRRDEILDRIGELVGAEPEIEVRYALELYWTRKR